MNFDNYKKNDPRMSFFHHPIGKWIVRIIIIIVIVFAIYKKLIEPLFS